MTKERSNYVTQWVIWFVVLMGLWLVVTGTFDFQETGVGLGASAVAATAAVAVTAQGIIRFRMRARWILHVPRLLQRVVVHNWTVLAVLVRMLVGRYEVRGAFRAVPFDPGGEDALSATRRALIISAVSLSPNT